MEQLGIRHMIIRYSLMKKRLSSGRIEINKSMFIIKLPFISTEPLGIVTDHNFKYLINEFVCLIRFTMFAFFADYSLNDFESFFGHVHLLGTGPPPAPPLPSSLILFQRGASSVDGYRYTRLYLLL